MFGSVFKKKKKKPKPIQVSVNKINVFRRSIIMKIHTWVSNWYLSDGPRLEFFKYLHYPARRWTDAGKTEAIVQTLPTQRNRHFVFNLGVSSM